MLKTLLLEERAVAADNNFYSGGLQTLSGYEEAFQPNSVAFKFGKLTGDAASLIAGAVTVAGGTLGEIGGFSLNATGAGAVAGVPLNIASTGAIAYGGAVTVSSAKGLVSDGINLISGKGRPINKEGNTEIKPGDKTSKGREYTEHGAGRTNERGFDSKKVDDIIDNNKNNRVKEIDENGNVTWRYQDKRGNTVITNEWENNIVTVYSYPQSANGGKYIPKK